MKRIVNIDAEYKTMDIKKNLARFAKKFPEAAEFCEINTDYPIEEIKKGLPFTDKFLADGTINKNWTYYFDIDFECGNAMYIWFIKRT